MDAILAAVEEISPTLEIGLTWTSTAIANGYVNTKYSLAKRQVLVFRLTVKEVGCHKQLESNLWGNGKLGDFR